MANQPCNRVHVWLQFIGVICSCKRPADIAGSVSHMRSHTVQATPLIVYQSFQNNLDNCDGCTGVSVCVGCREWGVWPVCVCVCVWSKEKERRQHLPSLSLCGRSNPLLPSSANAKHPPCQAASLSRTLHTTER